MLLDLERVCPSCHGAGMVLPDPDAEPDEPARPCLRCAGRGTLPTDLGRQLLDFLTKYLTPSS